MPTLKEITTRAKKIRKDKPRTKWQNAIKQASKELKAKYRKKEGRVGATRKLKVKPRVIKKPIASSRKKVTGRKGWTINGTHNVIYGVIKDTGKIRKFEYITTSYRTADKYARDMAGKLYVKEFIV